MASLVLGLLFVAYNNAINLWRPFHGRLYVPLNLGVCLAAAGLASALWDLSPGDLGLRPGQAAGLALGPILGVAAAVPLFAALSGPKTAAVVADRRLAGLTGGQVAYRALIRVPLGTAGPEELLFRGILFGALAAQMGPLPAAVWSSLAFGLWHITPTRNLLRENAGRPDPTRLNLVLGVAGGVVITAAAGLGLAGLRILTGGLAAPFAVHAAVNSLGTVAAHLANRKVAAAGAG